MRRHISSLNTKSLPLVDLVTPVMMSFEAFFIRWCIGLTKQLSFCIRTFRIVPQYNGSTAWPIRGLTLGKIKQNWDRKTQSTYVVIWTSIVGLSEQSSIIEWLPCLPDEQIVLRLISSFPPKSNIVLEIALLFSIIELRGILENYCCICRTYSNIFAIHSTNGIYFSHFGFNSIVLEFLNQRVG